MAGQKISIPAGNPLALGFFHIFFFCFLTEKAVFVKKKNRDIGVKILRIV